MADGLKLFEEELKSLPTDFQETAQWIAELRAWLQIQTGNARDQWVAASKALERAKEAACEEYDKVSDEIGEKTAWSGITARLTRGKQECTQRYKTEMASLPANLLVAGYLEPEPLHRLVGFDMTRRIHRAGRPPAWLQLISPGSGLPRRCFAQPHIEMIGLRQTPNFGFQHRNNCGELSHPVVPGTVTCTSAKGA